MADRFKNAAAETVRRLIQDDGLDSGKLQAGEYTFICTPVDAYINKLRAKLSMAKHRPNRRYFVNLESFLRELIRKYYGDYSSLNDQEYVEVVTGVSKVCPFARCCRSQDELIEILAEYYTHGMTGCCLSGIDYRGIYWLMAC